MFFPVRPVAVFSVSSTQGTGSFRPEGLFAHLEPTGNALPEIGVRRNHMKSTVNKQRIRDHLRTLHSDADLQAWFDPLRLKFSETGILEVQFPHALFSRWFGKEQQKRFEKDIAQLLEQPVRVVYAKPDQNSSSQPLRLRKKLIEPPATGHVFGDSVKFSFDAFIYNKKNEFPVTLAQEVAAAATNPPYVPFVLCGKGACGKTHLLRAMAGTMATSLPPGSIYFGTVEETAGLLRENPLAFKRKMMRHKAVFLDNGQNLTTFPDLQQELVFLAENFKEKKKPFVLAMDDSFDQTALNPKLRSRLESGLAVTVKKPDLDVRLRYAKSQCIANRISLKKELILSLAQRFNNLSTIQGIIAKASAFHQKTGKNLTSSDLEKLLAGADTLSGKPASPSAIIAQVADAFSLTPEDIVGNDRCAKTTLARQTAMYLCRELLGVPYAALGNYFSGKNHATVIYACNKIKKTIIGDKDMNKLVTRIRKKFLTASG